VAYLVKPLDVGQIVPTVDAALARLRAGVVSAPAVPTGAATPAAATRGGPLAA
jgi:hypothetical protein